MSWEKELNLTAEAVNMKAEVDRLQAELGLRAESQHRAWDGKLGVACRWWCLFCVFRFVLCCFVLRSRHLVSSIRNTTTSHNLYVGSSSSFPRSSPPEPKPCALDPCTLEPCTLVPELEPELEPEPSALI